MLSGLEIILIEYNQLFYFKIIFLLVNIKQMAPTKYNNKKKVVRRTSIPHKLIPIDGQNLIINGYFKGTKALTATSGLMTYTIQIDPKNGKIAKGAGATETFLKGIDDTTQLVNSNVDF